MCIRDRTSCGLNGGPLEGRGTYPAYIACNLFTSEDNMYTGGSGKNGFGPVSYTHLDVYKRQALCCRA